MHTVSVLLTCYNHRRHLAEAVRCLRQQSFKDFGIIAIDDGSTDGSREWLKENLPEATLIFNENNLGTYASLNVALQASTGQFIAILNDDDLWAPDKLEKQLAMFEHQPELGLVHTFGWFIDGDGNEIKGAPLGFEFPKGETGDVLFNLIYYNRIIASSVLVRRACFEKVGMFNETYFGSGDWEMWLRIAEEYPIGFVDEPLTFYRVHGANASHQQQKIRDDDDRIRDWIRSRYYLYATKGREGYALKKVMSHNEACLGTINVHAGRIREGREAYRNSLKLEPLRLKSYLRLWASYLPHRLASKWK